MCFPCPEMLPLETQIWTGSQSATLSQAGPNPQGSQGRGLRAWAAGNRPGPAGGDGLGAVGIKGNDGDRAGSGEAKSPTSYSLIGNLMKTIIHFRVPSQEQVCWLIAGRVPVVLKQAFWVLLYKRPLCWTWNLPRQWGHLYFFQVLQMDRREVWGLKRGMCSDLKGNQWPPCPGSVHLLQTSGHWGACNLSVIRKKEGKCECLFVSSHLGQEGLLLPGSHSSFLRPFSRKGLPTPKPPPPLPSNMRGQGILIESVRSLWHHQPQRTGSERVGEHHNLSPPPSFSHLTLLAWESPAILHAAIGQMEGLNLACNSRIFYQMVRMSPHSFP